MLNHVSERRQFGQRLLENQDRSFGCKSSVCQSVGLTVWKLMSVWLSQNFFQVDYLMLVSLDVFLSGLNHEVIEWIEWKKNNEKNLYRESV